LIIQEKILGYDSPTAAYGYSNLGLYYHTCQYHSKGFEYIQKALDILQVVCGDNHPDISAIYLNLGLMYQDIGNYNAAIDCFMDSLYCNQAIAHAYYLTGDYRMALDF
jgi:tetratricopeptide (TPR) repeat protein